MAWQYEEGGSDQLATDYRDLLTKMVAFITSQHVATVAVNSGGTGYTQGDVLTLTHAGAFLDARFEVTAVSSGVITALRVVSSGAFSNRVATVAVNAAGSGYSANEIVEIQGGTSRCKAKAKVLTVDGGGGVLTIQLFEAGPSNNRGGAYSSAPGLTGASTVGIGPAAFGGDDALTLNLTMTGLIGTTGLSVTGGSGSGATVDITLAETGGSVDSRNDNKTTINSLTDEKEVTIVFDAAGKKNKPYVHFRTETATSGINTRYGILFMGSIAHNPALAVASQPGFKSVGYLLCDENQAQNMRFWFSCDDFRVAGVVDINPAASITDDGEYMQFYSGFGDSYATEIEDPYPMIIAASAIALNVDPSATLTSITGLAECMSAGGDAPCQFYYSEIADWRSPENSSNGSSTATSYGMFPVWNPPIGGDTIASKGPVDFNSIAPVNRTSATRRYLPCPGSTPQHLPIPLIAIAKPGGTGVNQTLDTVRVQLRGVFWVSGSDDSAADITNFSEGRVNIGTDLTTQIRHRVFHQHVHHQQYHYVAFKEDVA